MNELISQFQIINYMLNTRLLLLEIIFAILAIIIELRKRKIRIIEEAFPDFLYNVTKSLRAGISIEQAIHDTSRIKKDSLNNEIIKSFEETDSFKEALTHFSSKIKSSIIRMSISIILTLKEKDVNLSDVLDRISTELWSFYLLYKERNKRIGILALFTLISGVILIPFTTAILVFIMQKLPDVVSIQVFLLILSAITVVFYWSITGKTHYLLFIPLCISISSLSFVLTLKLYSLGLSQFPILGFNATR